MSEISASVQSNHSDKIRSKKSSTRIDMTPMVDLAFLLLTFFVLTSALNAPFAMRIDMPEDDQVNQPPINESRVLTLILKEDDAIYWYNGSGPDVHVTNFAPQGIRKLLRDKKRAVKNLYVFIKASDQSLYKNLVDILDEMTITNIDRYAVVDITTEDEEIIKRSKR